MRNAGFPPTSTARLKPERIQQRLAVLSGWRLDRGGKGLARELDFPTAAVALAFLGYAREAAHGRRPRLTLSSPRLEILLPAAGELAEANLDFAVALAGLPSW